ncbi:MAG: GNAT family N-acetyltransferase [Thermoleophilaceae bacterium]|jgi:RimJ/RimL family protein N-acetyltransferase
MQADFPDRIETERLVLRRWREDDADAWVGIWSDPTVFTVLWPGAVYSDELVLDRLKHHLDHWTTYGFGLFALEERASGEVVGWTGPSHPDFAPELADEAELGWTLRSAGRGRGLATEAATAALRASLDALGRGRIISLIDPDNHASMAVARRIGMDHAGETTRTSSGFDLLVFETSR